jgi:hypothetical protein
MSQDFKPPTFWQAVKLLAVGFVTGTPGDLWRIRRALIEILDWGTELSVVVLKLITRWIGILTGFITFPVLAWYVLRINRIEMEKRRVAAEEAKKVAEETWGKQP